jgi:Ca2+-binding RTX toxin-like protein
MRWHRHHSITAAIVVLTTAFVVAAATASAAFGAPVAQAKKEKVKAKIHDRTLEVTGTNADETIALRLRSGDPSIVEVVVGGGSSADFDFRRTRFDNIDVRAGGGDDVLSVDESNGSFTDTEATTLEGEAGNDTLRGGSFRETFVGGDGNDFVDGNRGDDLAQLGAGDDTFQWDPGDASDTVEGQDGHDVMTFNGAAAAEAFDVSANGPRIRFFRNIANITMDLDDVEQISLGALGGADTLTVHDLSGTDLTELDDDLAGTLGGSSPDGAQDSVVVDGTAANDSIVVLGLGQAGASSVSGLQATVRITHADLTDSLNVDAGSGDDVVNAAALTADALKLTMDGGPGADRLLGGAGADTLIAGDGNDFVDGNRADDVAFLGAGDDTFQWDPGDGSDVIEGQDGTDRMLFNGANVAERFDLAANGGRLRFVRDIANITMDTDGVEVVDIRALGGADKVTVHDLSGTDVTSVRTDLAGAAGGGDGAADQVIVEGTAGDDVIDVAGSAGTVNIFGLAAAVTITNAEPAADALTVDALAGDDVVEASGLAANVLTLTAKGGDGDDVLLGSAGADILLGEAGDDVLIGGPGVDALDGGPGDNIVIQD